MENTYTYTARNTENPEQNVLDYWFTWILVGVLMFGLFQAWRRRADA